MTGADYERALLSELHDRGFAFVRSPASGARAHDQPDAVASKAGTGLGPLGIEAKSTAAEAYTIKEDEARQLRRWCSAFGATPVIALYWKGPPGGNVHYGGWRFRRLSLVRRSPVPNADGGFHLRPRREDRDEWNTADDIGNGQLAVQNAET